jgi:hypothetical protein
MAGVAGRIKRALTQYSLFNEFGRETFEGLKLPALKPPKVYRRFLLGTNASSRDIIGEHRPENHGYLAG